MKNKISINKIEQNKFAKVALTKEVTKALKGGNDFVVEDDITVF